MTAIHLTAAALALASATTTAFSPPTLHQRTIAPLSTPRTPRSRSLYSTEVNADSPATVTDEKDILAIATNPTLNLSPEGYGFSASMDRVWKRAGGMGYYRAKETHSLSAHSSLSCDYTNMRVSLISTIMKASESVIDVMEGIVSDVNADVALVFDDSDKLLGLFTDKDYIKIATERATTASEEESATFIAAPVSNFVTPASEIICVEADDTASQAIAIMTAKNIRHIILTDRCGPDNMYLEGSKVKGVIKMQDVMRVIQNDERLSFDKLTKKFPGFADKPIEQMREELKSRANQLAANPETAKKDIIRVVMLGLTAISLALFISQSSWLSSHAEFAMVGIFVLGYIGIIFEEVFEFNKAAVALLMSTGMWVTYADFYGGSSGLASESVLEQLKDQLAEVSDICFFLLAASAIVEVVDAHQGFKVVTNLITTKSKKGLFWVIGFLTFFLSSILNNLTVTIVMVSLLRKLIPNDDDRRLFGAMVVVAANAGGVWTPIGDVTTTMLWINNQLSTIPTITELFLPSMVCLVASLFFLVNQVEEDSSLAESSLPPPSPLAARGVVVFWTGIACLLAVPIFNDLTGLPPYIAMLTGLAAIWTMTDIIHMGEEEEEEMKVPAALSKLDTSGILFFLGILMSIGVLDRSGLLKQLAVFLNENLPSQDIIATVIGIASALIDNVPLVAATMGMYDLADYGTDDKLWQLIALCAGTGGSILVIGSASGVALMGLEKVDFLWYARKVTVGATIGYFAGIATYLAQNAILSGALLGASP
ncbi:hypothetical protein HJC23_010601 [Cyclotella cryptica]|uniref:CBS domain-containing protein n=1 Tax=Cyclotella cryptica TaxID=29204 RepID=A0ABD3PRC9_9STRA